MYIFRQSLKYLILELILMKNFKYKISRGKVIVKF